MAKKQNIWEAMDNKNVQKQAKKVMEKSLPKPKAKAGRPDVTGEEKQTRVVILESDRNKLKKLAALQERTMIEVLRELIDDAWKKERGKV